jgi:hypothetical protein
MPVSLTVNNSVFQYPTPGDEPGWGASATSWAVEVTEVLSSLLGPNDILETAFNINNNVVSPTNITGLIFNTASVRGATIEYSIYRISTLNPSGNAESGIITLIYDDSAAPGSRWQMAIGGITGNAGVIFSITDGGQVQYTSTDIDAVGYTGIIKFSAKAKQQ